MLRRLLLATVAFVPLLSAAQPSEPAGRAARTYLFANAGAAWARHDELRTLGLHRGRALGLGAGIVVAPHLAVQATAGWLAFAHDESLPIRTGNDPASPVEQLDLERELRAIPLLATARVFGGRGKLEVFGLAGAGVVFTSLDVTSRSSLTGSTSRSYSDAPLAIQVGAGVSAALSDRVALGAEARYLAAEATWIGRTARLDSLVVTAALAYGP